MGTGDKCRSEYWKSNPRKYCDFCKCWIAENKPSIEFHERGKRHKENVQKRLEEIGRKGQEDYENKLKEDDYMQEMEQAALKAYKNDIESNPDLTGSQIAAVVQASNADIVVGTKKNKKQESTVPENKISDWFEAKSPEGTSYYWHKETGESVWEAPRDGFRSLEEQNKKQKKSKSKAKSKSCKTSHGPKSKKCDNSPIIYGPEPKANPYGSWESSVLPEEHVELQLPEVTTEDYYVPEVVIKKPEISFTEKTVTLSKEHTVSAGPVMFKKRKMGDDHKKNMRRRDEET